MSTHRACIGLGANLGDPAAQLRDALALLAKRDGVQVRAVSRFYRSAPLGPADQPDYCNAVASVDTTLDAFALHAALIDIERALGRERGGLRWGPRLIDLDLLVYADRVVETPALRLPHPEMHRRNFVLAPLAELEPGRMIPGHGRVDALAQAAGTSGLSLWTDGLV